MASPYKIQMISILKSTVCVIMTRKSQIELTPRVFNFYSRIYYPSKKGYYRIETREPHRHTIVVF